VGREGLPGAVPAVDLLSGVDSTQFAHFGGVSWKNSSPGRDESWCGIAGTGRNGVENGGLRSAEKRGVSSRQKTGGKGPGSATTVHDPGFYKKLAQKWARRTPISAPL